jgi:glyoxylate/hydroxypyruvate reductase
MTQCCTGYDVTVWGRTAPAEAHSAGVSHIHSACALRAALPAARVLVCLLPLTPALRGVLCADVFARLPRGTVVINAGRGAHVVEADLLAALQSGAHPAPCVLARLHFCPAANRAGPCGMPCPVCYPTPRG